MTPSTPDASPAPEPLRIEQYAIIGDQRTVGLVGIDGSIDWLCLPRFDSASCFSALLVDADRSRWLLGAAGKHTATRRYIDGTNVLETTITTTSGEVRVTDVMPTGDERADVVRRIEGIRGTVRMRHAFVVRFDYGRIRPWVHRVCRDDGSEVIVAVAGPDKLVLAGPRLPRAVDSRHEDEFDVGEGESLDFSLTWIASHRDVPPGLDATVELDRTIAEEQHWSAQVRVDGPYAAAVARSLLTLRALTHEETGGIVAAPTTSLPEELGGERNWDYRYSWLRDAALTVQTMIGSEENPFPEQARPWRDWLLRAIAGDPEDMQVMYTVDGGRHLPEIELEHLAGYASSKPVRIGNGAVDQRQSDVVGEVISALAAARGLGLAETQDGWSLQRTLVGELARTWHLPDHGIWEIRGPERHFTHSRVMAWAAFDRMVLGVEEHGFDGPVDLWRDLRSRIRAEVLDHGYDARRNTFTQHDATGEVDASLLLLPLVGFVEGDDPRMVGTIEAVESDLLRDGLVLRYRTETGVDGLGGDESPFLACSFWLVSAYALAGRYDDATALMDRLVGLGNDVGLFSEEYDVGARRMVGNFPQAFTHLALVQAARTLARRAPVQSGGESVHTSRNGIDRHK
ncbi:MAG: glycoside hydrolase 15-related protein [Marmoricola sp.]|nr:glycoside hydrolase 15-related protein [Marmoricola sp.]